MSFKQVGKWLEKRTQAFAEGSLPKFSLHLNPCALMSASGQVKFTGNADKLFATFPCGKGNLELVSRGDLKKTGASSAAKGHKQSAISLFYRRQCDLPSLVVKSHHQERHFAVESTLLELVRTLFLRLYYPKTGYLRCSSSLEIIL